jgi:hypothetical protein
VLETHGARLEDLSAEQRQQALDALNAMSAKPTATASASPSPSPSVDKKTARAPKKKTPQNEVVIDVGTLAQKGYPAPVALDDGSGKPPSKKKTIA